MATSNSYTKGENLNDIVSIADDFSTTSTYAVGKIVRYNGKMYRCTTAITTAGAWDASKWSSAAPLADYIEEAILIPDSTNTSGAVRKNLDSTDTTFSAVATGKNATSFGGTAAGAYSHAEGYGISTSLGTLAWNASNKTITYTATSCPVNVNEIIRCGTTFAAVTKIDFTSKLITVDSSLSSASGNLNLYKVTGVAFGAASHAEGEKTVALGQDSHAEGNSTTASGGYSHAEGRSTTASGGYSHAEGRSTTASGDYSHAEGFSTTASGGYSHAEGSSTTASGDDSHAEGFSTTASGGYSHAEGSSTTASGDYSHAEGESTVACGYASHAEGFYGRSTIGGDFNCTSRVITYTSDICVVKKGDCIFSNGQFAFVAAVDAAAKTITCSSTFGYTSDGSYVFYLHAGIAFGSAAHAEGGTTTASGDYSHAEGATTTALGGYSHAEGWGTAAYGTYSHAEGGVYSYSSGNYSHAEGRITSAYGICSHAEGSASKSLADCSHAEGLSSAIDLGTFEWSAGVSCFNYTTDDSPCSADDILLIGTRYARVTAIDASTKTIYLCRTITRGTYKVLKLLSSVAAGQGSHVEGVTTVASNLAEHAQGAFNVSTSSATDAASVWQGDGAHTLSSVGIGTSDDSRKNAQEVMQNGDFYILGVGGYDGTNAAATGVKTLQQLLSSSSSSSSDIDVSSVFAATPSLPIKEGTTAYTLAELQGKSLYALDSSNRFPVTLKYSSTAASGSQGLFYYVDFDGTDTTIVKSVL